MKLEITSCVHYSTVRLVGCFGFNGPLRQYFSLHWAVKFAFQHDRVKVKVAVTVFRKTLQLKASQASKGKKSY